MLYAEDTNIAWSTPSTRTTGDLITAAIWNQDVVANPIALLPTGLGIIIDGAGSAITAGIKGDIPVPYSCTITMATLLADQTGSIVIDIWKDTYANFPPTDGDSITASAPPTITTALKSQDSTLTGWTTTIAANSILRINVDSCTTITRATLFLNVTRT